MCRKEQGHDRTWAGEMSKGRGRGAFIHLTVDKHLGYFPFLPMMNNNTMNTCVQVFFENIYVHFSWINTGVSEIAI